MNQIVQRAADGAGAVMGRVVDKLLADERAISQQEAMNRYVREHRGRPDRIAAFVAQNAPRGMNPFAAGAGYEREMESALRSRRVKSEG